MTRQKRLLIDLRDLVRELQSEGEVGHAERVELAIDALSSNNFTECQKLYNQMQENEKEYAAVLAELREENRMLKQLRRKPAIVNEDFERAVQDMIDSTIHREDVWE